MMPFLKNREKQKIFGIGILLGIATTGIVLHQEIRSVFLKNPLPIEKAYADPAPSSENPPAEKREPQSTGLTELKKSSESFRNIAKRVGPAVVNIKATKSVQSEMKRFRGRRRLEPEDNNGLQDPFRDFFERFGDPFFFQPFPQPGPQISMGSGIIIDKKGIIATNNHVVKGATEVMVMVGSDTTEHKAKVLGTDSRTDLAVLKLEKEGNYPFIEWADSDEAEVGDWAIAIGSPFALGQSVTVGIVSAKGRSGRDVGFETTADFIQTDAAINPGNSGGPLCDLNGKVMGVNTAIYSRSGGYMGIGFAISSNTVKDIVGKLLSDGKIVRGWLGVYIQSITPDLIKELGVKGGVSVHEVVEGSPAEKAGLNAGDIILEVEGKAVDDSQKVQRTIGNFKPGQVVQLKVMGYNDKKTRTLKVTIGTLPEEGAEGGEAGGDDAQSDVLGIVLSQVPGKRSIVIRSVLPGSLAQAIGMKEGDIILRVNRKAVDSIKTFNKILSSTKKYFFEVQRGGRTLFFQLTLPE